MTDIRRLSFTNWWLPISHKHLGTQYINSMNASIIVSLTDPEIETDIRIFTHLTRASDQIYGRNNCLLETPISPCLRLFLSFFPPFLPFYTISGFRMYISLSYNGFVKTSTTTLTDQESQMAAPQTSLGKINQIIKINSYMTSLKEYY